MSFQFWLGCGLGVTVLVLGCLFALAMCNVGGADAHIEHKPLVTIVDGGTVIGKAEVLHRKGKYATVRFEGGQVVSVNTEFVELIEGSE